MNLAAIILQLVSLCQISKYQDTEFNCEKFMIKCAQEHYHDQIQSVSDLCTQVYLKDK